MQISQISNQVDFLENKQNYEQANNSEEKPFLNDLSFQSQFQIQFVQNQPNQNNISSQQNQQKSQNYCVYANTSSSNSEYLEKDGNLKKKKISKAKNPRGPYKRFTEEEKQKIINLVKKRNFTCTQVSKQQKIPLKNIKRWIENGPNRKQGGGRKTQDPDMELRLSQQIIQKFQKFNQKTEREEIRKMALNFSKMDQKFKASKGWMDKFIRRHKLQDYIQKRNFSEQDESDNQSENDEISQSIQILQEGKCESLERISLENTIQKNGKNLYELFDKDIFYSSISENDTKYRSEIDANLKNCI